MTEMTTSRQGARIGEWLAFYGLSVLVALLLSALLVEATGGDWRPVVSALLDGSLRRPGRWGETLGTAAPMLLVAVGTIISGKAGLVNIGQEGQLFVGAAFATYFGFLVGGPGPLPMGWANRGCSLRRLGTVETATRSASNSRKTIVCRVLKCSATGFRWR